MQVDIPFSVRYETEDTVTIDEIIESLVGIRAMLREGIYSLPCYIDDIKIEHIQINVRSIAHESPLREIFFVSLFLAFQDDLEREVPDIIQKLTGQDVPESMDTLVTVVTLAVLFYGVGALRDVVVGVGKDGPAQQRLNSLIDEIAALTGKPREAIKKALDTRFKKQGKLNQLSRNALRFFRPSKAHGDAAITIGNKTLERDVVADVPPEFMYEDAKNNEVSREFRATEIELHAQDRDKSESGWAAIVLGLTEKRVRMKLVDEVTADQLWQRDRVNGDGVIVYKRDGETLVPTEIHLSKLRD